MFSIFYYYKIYFYEKVETPSPLDKFWKVHISQNLITQRFIHLNYNINKRVMLIGALDALIKHAKKEIKIKVIVIK
jgi:hypothetical protein